MASAAPYFIRSARIVQIKKCSCVKRKARSTVRVVFFKRGFRGKSNISRMKRQKSRSGSACLTLIVFTVRAWGVAENVWGLHIFYGCLATRIPHTAVAFYSRHFRRIPQNNPHSPSRRIYFENLLAKWNANYIIFDPLPLKHLTKYLSCLYVYIVHYAICIILLMIKNKLLIRLVICTSVCVDSTQKCSLTHQANFGRTYVCYRK